MNTVKTHVQWFLRDRKDRGLSPRTVDFYKEKLRYLTDDFGDREVETITHKELKALVYRLRDSHGWQPSTTNLIITTIKAFFSYLEQEEEYKIRRKLLEKLRDKVVEITGER